MMVVFHRSNSRAGRTVVNSGQPAASENLSIAKDLIQTARFGEAISLLENILNSGPDDDDRTEALYMLAVAQRYGKQPGKALATLDTLLGQNSEYARAYQERGHLFLSLNRSEDAAQAYARAVDLKPCTARQPESARQPGPNAPAGSSRHN